MEYKDEIIKMIEGLEDKDLLLYLYVFIKRKIEAEWKLCLVVIFSFPKRYHTLNTQTLFCRSYL